MFIGTPSALRRPGEFTIITPQGAGLTGIRVTLWEGGRETAGGVFGDRWFEIT